MPDTFIPFATALKSDPFAFTALKPKEHDSQPVSASGATNPMNPSTTAACAGKPVITLQRSGGTVSSIRVQCGCGEIIDLACVY